MRRNTIMLKISRWFVALTLVLATTSLASAGEVKVTLNNGLVTVIADEVPVSRILAEWARIGQTKIVNGEKLMTVVSLQLVDMPERKALDVILRSASGYMAAERPTPIAGASSYDRIMILPFSAAPPKGAVPVNSMPQPFNPRPMPQPEPMDDDPVQPPGVGPQPNQPTNMSAPGLPGGPANGQQPVLTSPRPGQLPTPGPQQPVPFGTPAAPGVKPPGGGGGGRS